MEQEIISREDGLLKCPFCEKEKYFRGLVYHTRQVHGINAKEIRTMFHLPNNYSLQTKELKELRRKQALENKMDVQLISAGQRTRFKLGNKLTNSEKTSISKGHMKKRNYFK